MLEWLQNTVIWRYPPDTTVERLRRHRTWAKRFVLVCMGSGVLMISAILAFLLAGPGFARDIVLVIAIASTAACFLSALPAICSLALLRDIDTELRHRGLDSALEESMGRFIGVSALKMMAYAILLVAVASLLHKTQRG